MLSFTITKSFIAKAKILNNILSGIKSRNDAFPIAVKVEGKNITAVSPDFSGTMVLSSEELGLMPELETEPFLLPKEGLELLLETPTETEVAISVDERIITINRGRGKRGTAKLSRISGSIPAVDSIDKADVSYIASEDLLTALEVTRPSQSNNLAKLVYCGVQFVKDGEHLAVFSTDGFRGGYVSWKTDNGSIETHMSVPTGAVNLIKTACTVLGGQVAVISSRNNRNAAFIFGKEFVLKTKLYEGNVISAQTLFPESKKTLIVNKVVLQSAFRAMRHVVADNKAVRCILNGSRMTLRVNSVKGMYEEEVELESTEPEPMEIGFNLQYFSDEVGVIPTDKIKIAYSNAFSPVLLYPVWDDDKVERPEIKCVLVPMRLSGG